MILRRITDAFRNQDWFTVAVETLIVVLGVFLGLQVNNWNAARMERQTGEQLVQRLHEELTLSLAQEQTCVERMEQYFTDARDTYESLRSGEPGEGGEAAFRQQFAQIGPWTDLCIIRSTLDDLHAGRIALVRDEEIKRIILQFHDDLEGTDTSIANLGGVHMQAMQEMYRQIDYDWKGENRRLVSSFDEISDNTAAVRSLGTTTFIFSTVLQYHRRANNELQAVHQALAEYLGDNAGREGR